MIKMGKYDDIINIKYQKSTTRKHMSMRDRAAQFGAFKALREHDDAVAETARLTEKKAVLDEYKKEELNNRLVFILENLECRPLVTITYFVPDEKKQGGAYVDKTGIIKNIHALERMITMYDGIQIPIDEILAIESDILKEY